jgi:hypothetical protein
MRVCHGPELGFPLFEIFVFLTILSVLSSPMPTPLKAEFDYYVAHQDELVAKYHGLFVVIRGNEVLGAFKSELEAVREVSKKYPAGTFLVQKCEPGKENYTQSFHSQVTFA